MCVGGLRQSHGTGPGFPGSSWGPRGRPTAQSSLEGAVCTTLSLAAQCPHRPGCPHFTGENTEGTEETGPLARFPVPSLARSLCRRPVCCVALTPGRAAASHVSWGQAGGTETVLAGQCPVCPQQAQTAMQTDTRSLREPACYRSCLGRGRWEGLLGHVPWQRKLLARSRALRKYQSAAPSPASLATERARPLAWPSGSWGLRAASEAGLRRRSCPPRPSSGHLPCGTDARGHVLFLEGFLPHRE